MKNNFTKALKEIAGIGEDSAEGENLYENGGEQGYENSTYEGSSEEGNAFAQGYEQSYESYEHGEGHTDGQGYYTSSQFKAPTTVEAAAAEGTHISSTMVVNGDIKSKEDVRVDGQVYGDLSTKGNLISTNVIVGDVHAANACLYASRTEGDVTLDGHLDIGKGAVLVGDVMADSISVSGKVKGNMEVRKQIRLNGEALVFGDIISDNFSADQGSRISGSVRTRSESGDLDAEFDFGGEF